MDDGDGATRFGLQTVQTLGWETLAERWRRYEELGFDSLWVPDHFVAPSRPEAPFLEAWTLLSALATWTARARIGVLVSSNTFRHPALLAKQAVTVDHVSGGRLEVGLGAGWYAPEHAMFGLPFPQPAELVERYREAVAVVDALLRQETTTLDGRYYPLRDATSRPAPVQRPRPPLVLGAHGPKMLAVVAAHADAWNSYGTPEEIRDRGARLDDACAAAGRDRAAVRRSLLFVPMLMPAERPWDSVDAFRDFVGRYREAGVEEFILQPPADDGIVERVAADVLPDLRRGRSP